MLKWKLHNALQKRSAAAAGATTEFHWSQQSYTLQEIVQKFKLPCLVLCTSDCNLDWNAFHFNLKQPLLLHSTRTVLKATAHCLRRTEPSRQYEKIGTSVVIPEDYAGGFLSASFPLSLSLSLPYIPGCERCSTFNYFLVNLISKYRNVKRTHTHRLITNKEHLPDWSYNICIVFSKLLLVFTLT